MAAVVGSVPGSSNQKRVGFGSVEPALIALLKQSEPLATVLMLAVCAVSTLR